MPTHTTYHCVECGRELIDGNCKGVRMAYPCRTCHAVTTFERAT